MSSSESSSFSSSFSTAYHEAKGFQKVSAVISVIAAFIGFILMIDWGVKTQSSESFLGGLNFNEQILNLHPVFMYGGMVFAFTAAIVSFRLIPLPKAWVKMVHVVCHTFATVLIVLGIVCVVVGNNNNDYSNLYSLHSFIGLGAIFVYCQNYVLGVYYFLSSLIMVPVEYRKVYLPIHVCLGGVAFVLALMAVETGIMELFVDYGCGYTVTSPDTDPIQHYHRLTYGCQIANGIAVVTGLVAVTAFIALYKFPKDFFANTALEKLMNGGGEDQPPNRELSSQII